MLPVAPPGGASAFVPTQLSVARTSALPNDHVLLALPPTATSASVLRSLRSEGVSVSAVAAQLGEQAGAAFTRRDRDDRHVRGLGLHGGEHRGLVRPGQLDVEHEQGGVAGAHGVEHRDPVADGADRHTFRPQGAQH